MQVSDSSQAQAGDALQAQRQAQVGLASRNGGKAQRLSDVWEVQPSEVARVRCIGRGACGTVWQGHWRHARVAIKDLDVLVGSAEGGSLGLMDHQFEMLTAFRVEVAQLTLLRHPNILAFYGAVSSGDKL